MSADEEKRMLYNARRKQEWDIASLNADAEQRGMQRILALWEQGLSVEEAKKLTGYRIN